MSKIILAGDIGGTKTLLKVAQVSGSIDDPQIQILSEQRFDSQSYGTFDVVMTEFIQQFHSACPGVNIQNACIGVAGPVKGDYANVTNLPWKLHAVSLAEAFGMEKVRLVNDFQAVGYGIEMLAKDDLCQLQDGNPQQGGVRAVVGAGTGFGHGILVWMNGRYEVLSSEAGHASFAPTDPLQLELLHYFMEKNANVSNEMVCSGPGLENIYEFLCAKHGSSSELLTAAQITQLAFDEKDVLAEQALKVFAGIYGSLSGDLALTCMPTAGLYIAGGIAPKILPALQQGDFLKAFNNKSKMQNLLRSIPVLVVTNPEVGLLGTVAIAAFRM